MRSYVGQYEDGGANWTGCANVKLRRLESAAQFGHYILAFNINTNGWVATYVYKVAILLQFGFSFFRYL